MTATVHDPVCHMDIDPTTAAGTSEYNGQTYYFCSLGCKKAFDKEPEKISQQTSRERAPTLKENRMFKKLAFTFLLVVVLSQFAVSTAYAMGEPTGDCAPGFSLEMAMEHNNHQHHHQHVGTDADQNGDGYICMKPVTPDGKIHVHVDNNVQ